MSDNQKKLLAKTHLRACIQLPFGVYDQVLLCHSEKNSENLDLINKMDLLVCTIGVTL
jgi:hypothetical protein